MRTLALLALLGCSLAASAKPPPKSISALRDVIADVRLERVSELDGGDGYVAALYRYQSDGLIVHAMVATPHAAPPADGYPVLVFNHGFHPDPPRYGVTADGHDRRPGDYYRRIPELFANHGYLVVIPDYRGHSISEGLEYTEGLLGPSYYAEDVVNLLLGLGDIPEANPQRLFMMGHSMGGDVTLRTLVSVDGIRAASLWSTVGGNLWDQAYYYSRIDDPLAGDSSDEEKPVVTRLRRNIDALAGNGFKVDSVDPIRHLDGLATPVIIHHATGDRSTAFDWSVQLAQSLYLAGATYEFHSYDSDAHLFEAEDLERAVSRDVAFFARFDVEGGTGSARGHAGW